MKSNLASLGFYHKISVSSDLLYNMKGYFQTSVYFGRRIVLMLVKMCYKQF